MQRIFRFADGYGASVVQSTIDILPISMAEAGVPNESWGASENLWELAVIRFETDDIEDYQIVYDSFLAIDVVGFLSEDAVQKMVKFIADFYPGNQVEETRKPMEDIEPRIATIFHTPKIHLSGGPSVQAILGITE